MNLERRLAELLEGQEIHHACEVGVHVPKYSKIIPLAEQGVRCTFVEPLPEAFERLEGAVAHLPNVRLFNVAIAPEPGEVTLVQAGPSSFLAGLRSPAVCNDGLAEAEASSVVVQATTFDSIDDGTIDLLRVDVEGAEWYVIEKLVSRPIAIVLELYGKRYTNPFAEELREWMEANGYLPVLMNREDVVFFRSDRVRPTWRDRARLLARRFRVRLRQARGRLGGSPSPAVAP